jgi:hypothetical protein
MRTPNEREELAIIQQTDVDAKKAKRSAVELHYLDDPFITEFVPAFDRKPPLINRGTVHARNIHRQRNRNLCPHSRNRSTY